MAIYGALLGLSAPGYHLGWLAWLALIPALLWAYRCPVLKKRILGGFLFGFCFQALYCLWFFDLHPLTWLGFDEISSRLVTLAGWLLINTEGGLLTALFFGACHLKYPLPFRLFGFPILWLALFTLLHATPMALPWGLLEYTQATFWPLRWLAGYIGGNGITVLLLLHNVSWAEFFLSKPQQTLWKALPWAISCLIIPLGLAIMPPEPKPNKPYPIPVAIVQADLPIELIRSGQLSAKEIEPAYLQPIRNTLLPAGTLVLLPEEGVVPDLVALYAPERNPLFLALEKLAQQKKIYIAVGISSLSSSRQLFNSIALIPPTADQPVRFYHKRRLVPFGEYTPYDFGTSLTELLNQFQVDYSAPYSAGAAEAPLSAGLQKLGGLVCFELIDSVYAKRYQQQKASLLINLSNLGWFHQNPLLEAQFLAIGQLRAAETRTPLAIASNTGISAILSDSGAVLKQTIPSKRVKNSQKQPKSQIIFYNQ
jgi:apolipoprotein N-acyltransferase